MPKTIISDFSGGLSDLDKNIPNNQFAVGDGLDIHTLPGYILPSLASATVTYSGASPQIIDYSILDTALDLVNNKAYHITDVKLFQETSIGGGAFNSNFDGSSHYYKAIGSASLAAYGESGVVMYKKNDVPFLFYIYGTSGGGDIGSFNLASTFADTYFSSVATGGAALQKARHPYLEWNSYLWIGNGRYLAKLDGTTVGGANGTAYPTQLDLGQGWEITGLFPTNNYIGVVARKAPTTDSGNQYTYNRVFFYDGTSTNYAYFVPLSENLVEGVINFNGRVLFAGVGRNPASQLMQLTNDGNDILMNLRLSLNSSYINFGTMFPKGVISLKNRILFIPGSSSGIPILSYGNNKVSEPNALSMPFVVSTAVNTSLRYIKQITNNIFYFSWYDNTGANGYYLSKVDLSGSTYGTAKYKSGYIDMGQKVRINYVKFYFKPLVSGDSITPTLETDYGTSNTLKDPRANTTISYANDGGTVTSKIFKTGELKCHAFRPALSWTAGGTPFSKIVIDYDFIQEDD